MESAKKERSGKRPCVNEIFVLLAPSSRYTIFKQVNCTHQNICCLHAALHIRGRASVCYQRRNERPICCYFFDTTDSTCASPI